MLSSVTCSVPLTASATSVNVAESSYTYEDYSDWTYELLENGEGYRVLHYNGDQSKVKIPNKINNLPVYEIGRSAFENNSNLISVIIPESVNIIAESAFLNCTNLSKVYYTGTQDNWHNVIHHYGNECITPEEIYFDTLVKNDESGVWVAEKINDDMCILLDYLGNANKVQIPSHIEDKQVMEVKEYSFADNNNMTAVIIPESIERIREYAFLNCTNLSKVYYTGTQENWHSVIHHYGNECITPEEVYFDTLVKNDESGVWVAEKINDDMCILVDYFGNANKVQIPSHIENKQVMEIVEYLFADNNNMTAVIIPESIKRIREYAFLNCTNLSKVYYTGTQENWHNVIYHYGNESITPDKIYFDTLVKNDESGVWVAEKINDDMCILVDYLGNANKVQIPSKIEDRRVIEIGEYVFADNSNLTKLIISNSIERISEYAFMNCTNLGMVYYTGSRENWQNVMIGLGNEALKSKEVYCDALVKNDESGVWVAHQMFDDACIITEYFGNANKVQIPSEIEDKQVMEIGEYVFADNSNLTKLIIPKGIEKISDFAFMNCTNLGMVYYTGSREDWYNVMIDSGNEALKSKEVYCDALVKNDESGVWVAHQMFDDTCIITDYFGNANKVQIPSEIADRSVMEIGECLFAGNNNLTTVIIPESIKHIREGVFMNCDKLSDVYYTGNESQWCNVSVNHDNHSLINATIHYNYTESVKGDVNGDNRLAVDDVIYVLKGIVGDMELTAEQIENADLSGDGQLTVVDAVLLQRAILEL